ncbi:MAG: pancreas/duodenum homeobox protein 1 [Candidatus Desulfaltia sp.]|nr:pancreas/duodenum homeobox protein 1 [Candidatus Desulfaltia sp.]
MLNKKAIDNLFPSDRADQFFEALFGDASEGSYDISLEFQSQGENSLFFEFHLKQRPGKCLSCNLTYGLPEVFSRHPVINIKGIVSAINQSLNVNVRCSRWELGSTRNISRELHIIPLTIYLDKENPPVCP